MASTNKTQYYELDQYIATDKPTYLTDFNNDMSIIDSGMHSAQTKADGAYTLANTADGKADTAITNAGIAQTDASSALTKIGTLANLNTTEKTNLVGAVNEVNTKFNDFNLSITKEYNIANYATDPDIEVDNANITFDSAKLNFARNTAGTIYKVYGEIRYNTNNPSNEFNIILKNTGLNPTNGFNVATAGFIFDIAAQSVFGSNTTYSANYEVLSNGNIKLHFGAGSTPMARRVYYFPSLYFAKDFGDTPNI